MQSISVLTCSLGLALITLLNVSAREIPQVAPESEGMSAAKLRKVTEKMEEYGGRGMASTHFWVSPQDDLLVVSMEQNQPYSRLMEFGLKALIYDALKAEQ